MRTINVKIVNTSIEFTDNFDDRLCINLTFEGNDLSDCWSVSLNRLESLLKALNVNRYEDIKNSFARLKLDDKGNILSIGHIVNDYWLSKVYLPEDKKISYDEPSNKDLLNPSETPLVRCVDCEWCRKPNGDSTHFCCYKGAIDSIYDYILCPVFVSKDSDKLEPELR